MAVDLEGLLWYILGVFPVQLVFSAKKAQDERWEVVREHAP
jgi:hypothetical protein